MPTRSRSRKKTQYLGQSAISGFPPTKFFGWTEFEAMTDFVGNPKGQNPLALHRARLVKTPLLNTTLGLTTYTDRYPSCAYNFPARMTDARPFVYDRTLLEALSDSHPGEPTISIPNFIYELKDIPAMFRHYMRLVRDFRRTKRPPGPSALADEWLAWNFGWLPLYSDLKSLYKVAEGVKRQARRYAKAKSEGHVSTRGKRGTCTVEKTLNNQVFTGDLGGVYATCNISCESEAWTTAWWTATDNLPLYALLNGGHRDLLLDQLGLDVSFQTLWNAMPWSWLVDWCTDASAIINIYSNHGGFRFQSGVAMEHVVQTYSYTPIGTKASYFGFQPAVVSFEEKNRAIANPSIRDVTINMFDGRQLSILAALIIGRTSRLARS